VLPFVVLYSDDELAGINKVIELNTPTQYPPSPWYRVVQGGGRVIFQTNPYATQPPTAPPTITVIDSTVDVKSTISVTAGNVSLNHSVLSESQIIASDVQLDHVEVICTVMPYYYSPKPIHWKNQIVQGTIPQE